LFKTIRNTQTALLNSKDMKTGRKQGMLKYMSLNFFEAKTAGRQKNENRLVLSRAAEVTCPPAGIPGTTGLQEKKNLSPFALMINEGY